MLASISYKNTWATKALTTAIYANVMWAATTSIMIIAHTIHTAWHKKQTPLCSMIIILM